MTRITKKVQKALDGKFFPRKPGSFPPQGSRSFWKRYINPAIARYRFSRAFRRRYFACYAKIWAIRLVTSYIGMTFGDWSARASTPVSAMDLSVRRRRWRAAMPTTSTSTSPLQVGQLDSRGARGRGDVCDRETVSLLAQLTEAISPQCSAAFHRSDLSEKRVLRQLEDRILRLRNVPAFRPLGNAGETKVRRTRMKHEGDAFENFFLIRLKAAPRFASSSCFCSYLSWDCRSPVATLTSYRSFTVSH